MWTVARDQIVAAFPKRAAAAQDPPRQFARAPVVVKTVAEENQLLA
jgi:hypothetical protein